MCLPSYKKSNNDSAIETTLFQTQNKLLAATFVCINIRCSNYDFYTFISDEKTQKEHLENATQ